jgi:hypothetical protein
MRSGKIHLVWRGGGGDLARSPDCPDLGESLFFSSDISNIKSGCFFYVFHVPCWPFWATENLGLGISWHPLFLAYIDDAKLLGSHARLNIRVFSSEFVDRAPIADRVAPSGR